jgi:putative membrane protein
MDVILDRLLGTLVLRPYVFGFLAAYLALAVRDLGARGAGVFLGWGFAVAFFAEYASTRIGVPFGLYHYTGTTRGVELFVSNVPFFDSLSFPFLAYAAWSAARWALGESRTLRAVGAAALLMMLLDVVIDPVAVRGARWFLGHVFYYPAGGVYFGVPLSNFAGWAIVGAAIVGGYVVFTGPRGAPRQAPGGGLLLYYAILAFNLAVTAWIGELGLLAAGILLHALVFLVLLGTASRGRNGRRPPSVLPREARG